MISNELMEKYQVLNVWKILRKEETIIAGFAPGFICECSNGKWLAVITDTSWEESDVLVLNTRHTATKRLKERGYFTRTYKIYPKKK